MTDFFTFESDCSDGRKLPDFDQTAVKNEPMLFSCDAAAAFALGGPITHAFLEELAQNDWLANDVIIDSRVHMLMPGWYPAIPGWHHDDVPRGEDGQPNYDTPAYRAEHAMALINGDICPTEFALGTVRLPRPVAGRGPTYGQWHPIVDFNVRDGMLVPVSVPSNRIIYFDWQTFHQGVAANANGWRWFGRATRNTQRKPTNEVRRQVQVYLAHPMEGW